MRSLRLTSIRGRLVLWYLAVLAVLLVALGLFQWFTVGGRLRASAAATMRSDACQELGVLGPSYLQTSTDLQLNATTLAQLLGGPLTAVSIVTPNGQTLASHDYGPPGAGRPLRLMATTIRTLIRGARQQADAGIPTCPQLGSAFRRPARVSQQILGGRSTLVIAVPLGPVLKPVGYAILGRSLHPENEAMARVQSAFIIGASVALILAALVALPIINRALLPLRHVTRTAEGIASGDLQARAQLAHSSDEVGRLGEAFDRMVDHLEGAQRRSAASEEQMRRFLADASHELRTPATVLRGASQVLLRRAGDLSPSLQTALRDMYEEAVRLSNLIEDLLTLSRLEGERGQEAQAVPVEPFVRDFLARYTPLWPERAISFEPGDLNGATASIAPEALRRILTNLVDNAARYSRPAGDIRIVGRKGGDGIALSVEDEGPGLSADDAAHVFDRFYRASSSRARAAGGTGLGLPIVRGLIEESGGTISIDTALDRGTTVTFQIPAGRPRQA